MRTLHGLIARPDGRLVAGRIGFSGIIEHLDWEPAEPAADYILPGLIDLQVNGLGTHEVMAARPETLAAISQELARTGTTAYLPTAITAPLEQIEQVDHAVTETMIGGAARPDSAAILGLHLEGPFISPRRLGAHRALAIEPSAGNLARVLALRNLRLITLAPELPGARPAIEALRAAGVAVSIGHSEASFGTARDAVAAGCIMFTHVFNAMAPLHHRAPGVVGAALTPSPAFAAVIPDGIHLATPILSLVYRARGGAGMLLVSDRVATPPAGGEKPASGLGISSVAHGARTTDGRLAGSLISLLDGVRRMVSEGVSLGDAARMAAGNPVAVLGLSDRGQLETGRRADLLVLDRGLGLKAVFVGGRELN